MYKVIAFLKDYLNLKRLETPIKIRFCTARQWLNQLGYIYRDIKKDVFVNGHERANVVEDRKAFLKIMLDLEPYLVEFDSKGNMKDKVYPHDCQVERIDWRPVIVIMHDECTFSANDRKTHGWQRKRDTFLCPKRKRRKIMVLDFLLPFS